MASIVSEVTTRLEKLPGRLEKLPGKLAKLPAWNRARSLVGRRIATALARSDSMQSAYARGKIAGRMVRAALSVDERPASELRTELADLLLAEAIGHPVSTADRDALRKHAVETRRGDTEGLSIAALSVLADRFDDRSARAWLPVALAEAGRFADAAELDPVGPPGPKSHHYPMLVTALHQLGRQDEAEQLMLALEERFPALRKDFTHIWGEGALSARFRELYEKSPAHQGALPVFQHLPFCAGTSMQFSLGLVVPWARTLQVGRRRGLLHIEQALRMSAEDVQQLMMVHQHHPFPLALADRPLSHFTVLRDPVSQIRSGFYKRSTRDKIVSTRDRDSADFAAHADYTVRAGLTNMLTRMVVTTHPELRPIFQRQFRGSGAYTLTNHEEELFYLEATRRFSEERLLQLARETLEENFVVVGTMAHVAAGHLACSASVGVPVAHTIAHRGRSGQPPQPEPRSVEGRLRAANAVDQQLYEEYTARFERDYPGLIEAVEGGAQTPGSAAPTGDQMVANR